MFEYSPWLNSAGGRLVRMAFCHPSQRLTNPAAPSVRAPVRVPVPRTVQVPEPNPRLPTPRASLELSAADERATCRRRRLYPFYSASSSATVAPIASIPSAVQGTQARPDPSPFAESATSSAPPSPAQRSPLFENEDALWRRPLAVFGAIAPVGETALANLAFQFAQS